MTITTFTAIQMLGPQAINQNQAINKNQATERLCCKTSLGCRGVISRTLTSAGLHSYLVQSRTLSDILAMLLSSSRRHFYYHTSRWYRPLSANALTRASACTPLHLACR